MPLKPAEKFEFTVNENGTVHFTTSHFSSYQIQYKKSSPDVKKTSKFLPSTGEQVTFLGIIGIILLGVVIYVLKKSKKK